MPILFGLTLIIIVFLSFSKSREKNAKKSSEEFWQREHASMLVPRKDISSLNYITIPYAALPFCYWTPGGDAPAQLTADVSPDSEELAAAEYTLCTLAESRIVNLTGISNTELRLTYGTANLEPLTVYDQNFTVLIRTLQKWGALLASAERKADAVTVLSYAVSIGSDIAGTYALLARLYKEQGELSKIEELKVSAESLTTLMKPSILQDLEQLSAPESLEELLK
ncbi:MAG: hypothetical protein PUC73_08690 [Lachnospiraceae bacterium]|nr:hypothetical protein [Lachnospiraceae bacterium]